MATKGGHSYAKESGDVLALLTHCRFFFIGRLIPPMSVVNDFLTVAAHDQSRSGAERKWESFQLDAAEYDDLVYAIRRRRFKYIASPSWFTSHRDWLVWCGEVVWGVLSLKRRLLDRRIVALERAIQEPSDMEGAATQVMKIMALRLQDALYFSENCSRKPKVPLFKPR